jgi:hypothetical protein
LFSVILTLSALVLLILTTLASSNAFAQAAAATVSGRVTDPQGLALPGVTVTVANPATGDTRRVITIEQDYSRCHVAEDGWLACAHGVLSRS